MERIEEKYIVEYIRDMINSSRLNKSVDVKDYKYHHNTPFSESSLFESKLIQSKIVFLNHL